MYIGIDNYYMASCMTFTGLFEGVLQRSQAIISAKRAGVAQLVELQPSKLNVASSNLVSRSKPELRGRNPDRSACGSKRTKRGLKKIAHVAQ